MNSQNARWKYPFMWKNTAKNKYTKNKLMHTVNLDVGYPHRSKTSMHPHLRPHTRILIHSLYSSNNTSMSSKLSMLACLPAGGADSEPPHNTNSLRAGDTSLPLASSSSSPSNPSISTGVTVRRARTVARQLLPCALAPSSEL